MYFFFFQALPGSHIVYGTPTRYRIQHFLIPFVAPRKSFRNSGLILPHHFATTSFHFLLMMYLKASVRRTEGSIAMHAERGGAQQSSVAGCECSSARVRTRTATTIQKSAKKSQSYVIHLRSLVLSLSHCSLLKVTRGWNTRLPRV